MFWLGFVIGLVAEAIAICTWACCATASREDEQMGIKGQDNWD